MAHPHRDPPTYACVFPGCTRLFHNKAGQVRHSATHLDTRQIRRTQPTEADPGQIPPPEPVSSDEEEADVGMEDLQFQRYTHPVINGEYIWFAYQFLDNVTEMIGQPCDRDGVLLPPNTAPPPRYAVEEDDWTPFDDRADFALAEFLYKKNQMSGAGIDQLLKIWATKVLPLGAQAPFNDHSELYATIDAIPYGDAQWKSFCVAPNLDYAVREDAPWMHEEYEVVFRSPRDVLRNSMNTSSFDGHIDYAAYRDVNPQGVRHWTDLMSGNWAYRQSVRFFYLPG